MSKKSQRKTVSKLKREARTSDKAFPLLGRVALITGGSRGIGLALARALAGVGAAVVISGRDVAALELAAGSIRQVSRAPRRRNFPAIDAVHCDISDPRSVDRLFHRVSEQYGHLDILINNAGLAHSSCEIAKLSLAEWQEVLGTNLTGMFLVTRAALPLMGAGGMIVNNLSVAATTIFPGMAAYTASKHGALGFTRTLREEVRGRQIRVLALMPGATDTAIWEQFWPDAPRQKMIPPDSVAQAVLSAVLLPEQATVSELVITPTAGAL